MFFSQFTSTPPSSPLSLLETFKAFNAMRVYSHYYLRVIFVQPIAAECWRGRGGKLLRILGKNTIFHEHPLLMLHGLSHLPGRCRSWIGRTSEWYFFAREKKKLNMDLNHMLIKIIEGALCPFWFLVLPWVRFFLCAKPPFKVCNNLIIAKQI